MIDDGEAIHYSAVERGTPVYSADGTEVGTVEAILDNYREHIFDGVAFRDREGTLRDLVADLVALGLRRGARAAEAPTDDGLGEAVLRRAAEIMRQRGWLPLGTAPATSPQAPAPRPPARKSRSASS